MCLDPGQFLCGNGCELHLIAGRQGERHVALGAETLKRGLANMPPASGRILGKKADLAHRRDHSSRRYIGGQSHLSRDIPVGAKRAQIWLSRRKSQRQDAQAGGGQFRFRLGRSQSGRLCGLRQLRCAASAENRRDGPQCAACGQGCVGPVLLRQHVLQPIRNTLKIMLCQIDPEKGGHQRAAAFLNLGPTQPIDRSAKGNRGAIGRVCSLFPKGDEDTVQSNRPNHRLKRALIRHGATLAVLSPSAIRQRPILGLVANHCRTGFRTHLRGGAPGPIPLRTPIVALCPSAPRVQAKPHERAFDHRCERLSCRHAQQGDPPPSPEIHSTRTYVSARARKSRSGNQSRTGALRVCDLAAPDQTD
mmetsp:Transcript_29737/g.59162  ORF Transcript_29737/g.59162 Transcript_29737/m.59162 type:complete len:362 (-) Transcript_29737:1969-3054(-)